MNRNANNRVVTITTALLAVFVAALFLGSCGGGDYEKPSTTLSGSALISASTLKSWIDEGKVNGTGYDRVVILDLTSYGTYSTTGHIPGALFVDSGEIGQNRNEGVGASSFEVLDGAKMDDLIQRYGIDGNTTIVFTSTSLVNPARAYFTFRYWGFPKNRLKLLDGLNAAWNSAYGLTTGEPSAVARSTYSAKNNRILRDDLRVSLAEMIDYADGKVPNAVAIDVRSTATAGSYAGVLGSTPGAFSSGPNAGKTVFEGRIRGAKALAGNTLYSSPSNTFKPVDELIAAFTNPAVGLDSTKTAYVYCVKGAASSVTFFVLDGILGWPAAVYDGSWQQWGQLSGNTNMKGQLDPNSPWRTDVLSRSDLVAYNFESPISAVTSSSALQNNVTVSGPASLATNATYTVSISEIGATDKFDWLVSGTTTTGVSITGGVQPLNNGVSILFGSTNGYALNDFWTFTATARKAVEQLTADGSACWATYLATTGLTSPSVCTNKPSSFDTDVNRIEEEDKAYMSSGGAGGSSGGGNSVPAGC